MYDSAYMLPLEWYLLSPLFTDRSLIGSYTDADAIIKHLESFNSKIIARNDVVTHSLQDSSQTSTNLEAVIEPEHYRSLNELLCGTNNGEAPSFGLTMLYCS